MPQNIWSAKLCAFFLDHPVLNAVTAIFHYSLAGLFTWIFIAVSTALQFLLIDR